MVAARYPARDQAAIRTAIIHANRCGTKHEFTPHVDAPRAYVCNIGQGLRTDSQTRRPNMVRESD